MINKLLLSRNAGSKLASVLESLHRIVKLPAFCDRYFSSTKRAQTLLWAGSQATGGTHTYYFPFLDPFSRIFSVNRQ